MSDQPSVPTDVSEIPSELDALKSRAEILGISFHPSISVDKLRARVNEALAEDENEAQGNIPKPAEGEVAPPGMTEAEYTSYLKRTARRRALALVRIRVSCLNPNKKEWEGEFFSTGSAKMGTIKKFVPFNLDEPYHVPRMILDMLKERKCTVFKTIRDHRGNKIREGHLINEFAVEELPPLTKEELKELAERQAMSGSIDN